MFERVLDAVRAVKARHDLKVCACLGLLTAEQAAALREAGVTAVFVEHDMEVVARFADRVAVWNRGRIAALGPPGTVLADPDVRREVIGTVAVPGAGASHAAA